MLMYCCKWHCPRVHDTYGLILCSTPITTDQEIFMLKIFVCCIFVFLIFEVRKIIFAFIFSSQNGLSWHFRTLKTRKHCFQTVRSLALSTVATAAEMIASPLTSSQNHAAPAAERGSKRAGAPCHHSRGLAIETNTS